MSSKPENLFEYLKQRRIAADLSQGEIANILGYDSPQFVSNWERGISKPPVQALRRLVPLLKLNVDTTVDLYVALTAVKVRKALVKSRRV